MAQETSGQIQMVQWNGNCHIFLFPTGTHGNGFNVWVTKTFSISGIVVHAHEKEVAKMLGKIGQTVGD